MLRESLAFESLSLYSKSLLVKLYKRLSRLASVFIREENLPESEM